MVFKTGPYRPVIFTAKDDNTVGDNLTNSTGHPTNYYASPALTLSSATGQAISGVRILCRHRHIGVFRGGDADQRAVCEMQSGV